MQVGVIGLGAMGSAIAKILIAAGHKVTVYNRSQAKADLLVKEGATRANNIAEAAKGDVVLTMVSNDIALSEILFGNTTNSNDGLLLHQGSQTVHISMSTISVKLARHIKKESAKLGKKFIAAPVMGRPDVAFRGELIVMPAGDSAIIEYCRPVFTAIGKSIHVIGNEPEQAILVKLTCNFMISSMIETFAESFALVRKNGIDHHQLLAIANDFFQSPVYKKYGKIIADGEFHTGAFTIAAQEKDTRLALEAAIESKVPMPLCTVIENAFLSAIGRNKGELDPCALAEIAAENAGL
jgi:3-hydroxyisobutyrate dehydrogenase-like beta-hydroxyacid dehydrogenase